MPCRVHFEGETLCIDFSGVVTNQDFAEFVPVVEELERGRSSVPHRISDLSQTSGLNIGFSDVFALAERRKATRFSNSFKSAIIAIQPAHVGLARMFQILNEHPQITIKIFPDLPAAQAWIAKG